MNFLSWWLSGAWEQSAGWWDCKRTRGCQQGQPLVHYSGGQSFTPSWITSGLFSFFPSLRELSKKSGHMEQSQQAGLFPFMFFCPLEAKAVPLLMAWVVPSVPLLPRAPCSPGADVVQDWLLCPFPWGEPGFLQLWKWALTTGPVSTQTLFKLLLQLEEGSAAVPCGRGSRLASPFYQLLRNAGELCPWAPPPVVVKTPEDDSQFGML